MLKSMTAYGRGESQSTKTAYVAELQSVNRRFLDIKCSLPQELRSIESQLHQFLNSKIHRGAVRLTITRPPNHSKSHPFQANLSVAKSLRDEWTTISEILGHPPLPVPLELIASSTDLFDRNDDQSDPKEIETTLFKAIENALVQLEKMKKVEGKHLEKDFLERIKLLTKLSKQVEKEAPRVRDLFFEKIQERIQKAAGSSDLEDERLLKEVALYAEKADITEEITRFQSHLKQMTEKLHDKKGNQGKTLEFLIQELLREVNTMGSKSSSAALTSLVIEMKTEIERMREQVQNVE